MLSYHYRFTNPYTGKYFVIGEDLSGEHACASGIGFALQQYPTFQLEVRNEGRYKQGQHGAIDFFSFYGNRNLTFSGIVMADSHANLIRYQRLMQEVLALPSQPINGAEDGYILISWEDDFGVTWEVEAKITQDLEFSRPIRQVLNSSFFLGLKSKDPYMLSSEEFSESEVRGWRQGRMTIPAFIPNNINIDWNRVINIYQEGTGDSPATYRVHGPGVSPKVTKLIESTSNILSITNFDEDTWTGGSQDTSHYQNTPVARKLTSTSGAQASMTLPVTLDLSDQEFINFYFFVDDATKFATGDYATGQNYIKLKSVVGVDEFVLEFEYGNGTIRDGWNYFQALKDEFKVIGAPTWTSILSVELSIKALAGQNLNVTFAQAQALNILHLEKKLELDTTLAEDQYVDFNSKEGTILDQDGNDVSALLTTDSEWFYLNPKQNLLLMESSDANPLVTYEYPYYETGRTIIDPVVETGLVAYWPFEETSGTTVEDIAGANNGVRDAAVSIDIGGGINGHNALSFNGVSGMVTVPDAAGLQNFWHTGASLFFCITPNSVGEGTKGLLINKGTDASPFKGWRVYLDFAVGALCYVALEVKFSGSNTARKFRSATRVIVLGALHTIEWVYNASSISNVPTLYVNGVAVPVSVVIASSGTVDSDVGYAMTIGNRPDDARTADSIIDEIRLYKGVEHTASEAYALSRDPERGKYSVQYKDQLEVFWRSSLV